MSQEIKQFYEFGDFRFDAVKNVLWRNGELVTLPPKASEVLSMLLHGRGNLVERQEILDGVWADTFVEEGNLNQAISILRRTLGDDGMIQTVPRRGYRFSADVRESDERSHQELVIERQTISHTVIQETDVADPSDSSDSRMLSGKVTASKFPVYIGIGVVVIVFAISGWIYFIQPRLALAAGSSVRSIAMLPLKSFSQNDDAELRMRITDALITKLGAFQKLEVRPTNAVAQYLNQDPDVIATGRALGVDAILEGRLQEESGRLRVTLQLISVANGKQLWSEQFDGHTGDILALQDTISKRLGRDFEFVEDKEFSRRPPVNNDAYESYLKGRYLWNQRLRDSYFKALEYFQQSVVADPNFALGYTGISDCYHLLQQRNEISTVDAFARAEPAAKRALELDPNLPEAYVSMGNVSFLRYSRWSEAERYFRRAIELNPNHTEAYARLGMLYNAWGRSDDAYEVLKKAESLDPTSVNNAIYLGASFYFSKQFDRAEAQFKRILEFAPNTERAHFFLYRIYEITGRYELAVDHILKEREIWNPGSVASLKAAYEGYGVRGAWLKQVELMLDEIKERPGLENHIASRYVLLRDHKAALHYIQQNIENFGSMTNYGRVDPIFDTLKTNSEYVELMERSSPTFD